MYLARKCHQCKEQYIHVHCMNRPLAEMDQKMGGGWHCEECFNTLRSTLNSLSPAARERCLRIRYKKVKAMDDAYLVDLYQLLKDHVKYFEDLSPNEEYTMFADASLKIVRNEIKKRRHEYKKQKAKATLQVATSLTDSRSSTAS